MTTTFLIVAAAMVGVALACVLVPMLRSARRQGRPRAPFWLALALVLLTPPVVFGAYLQLGTPQALAPAAGSTHVKLAKATQALRKELAAKPNNAEGWALLSQAYSALNQPRHAMDALQHLLALKPDNANAMVAWAEASAESNPAHRLDDAARAQLKHALKIDPSHQRALWLLGISDFQRGQYAKAATQWHTLLPLLKPGSKVAMSVKQELAEAKVRTGNGNGTLVAATDPTPSAATGARDPALTVRVTLAPKLATKVRPGDTLYVFARPVNGPAMPVAVARLKASALPAMVTLTNTMAMTPTRKLSKFSEVDVAARISKSGNAMPQPGDLESAPVQVATDSHKPVAVTIDKVD